MRSVMMHVLLKKYLKVDCVSDLIIYYLLIYQMDTLCVTCDKQATLYVSDKYNIRRYSTCEQHLYVVIETWFGTKSTVRVHKII